MKVCISGANGFVGRSLCERMAKEGFEVIRTIRHRAPGSLAVGDIGPDTDWRKAIFGCDVVVHLAARTHVMHDNVQDPLFEYRYINVAGTLALARQAALVGVCRFVFISSIKVNGEHTATGQPFCADDEPAPQDAYGVSKHEAEQGLMVLARETGMEVVIIRPPLVYGPGVKGNFASMVRWLRKGIPLPLGSVYNQRSLVALENLVNFIVLCSDLERSPRAANEVFLLSDGEDVSTTDLLCKVARAYDVRPCLIPVPVFWIRTATILLSKGAVADRLLGSLVVDSSKARDLLGWKPVVSMDEQLQKMALHDSLV